MSTHRDRWQSSAAGQHVLESLVANVDGVKAGLFATPDGFVLCHAGIQQVEPVRLAAMLSSLAAIGDAASLETGIGHTQCLVVDSTEGRLTIRCFLANSEPVVLGLLSEKSALLGLIWNAMAQAENMINNL